MQSLETIEMQNNILVGTLPKELSTLKSLRYVNLSNNQFTGEIPIFDAAQKLEGIDLNNN